MVNFCCLQFFLLAVFRHGVLAYYEERQEGEYVLGAMFPLHKAVNDQMNKTTCGPLNMEGVAAAEAFRLAVNTINKRSSLPTGPFPRVFGFDMRDTCSSSQGAMDVAYTFNLQSRQHRKDKSKPMPVSVVIANFDESEGQALKLLSLEGFPQLSYSPINTKVNGNEYSMLLSIYPGDALKIAAAIDAMRALNMQYFTAVISNDPRGQIGANVIKQSFKESPTFCSSQLHSVNTKMEAKYVVSKIGKNHLARAVLLHLDREKSLWIFEEAKKQNLTDVIWFSTLSWQADDLLPYKNELEGMISIGNKHQDAASFKLYVDRLKLPYEGNSFLKYVFLKLGGNKRCLEENATVSDEIKKMCDGKHHEITTELLKYNAKISYLLDAVLVFEQGVDKMLQESNSISLIDAMKTLDFTSSVTRNIIKFSPNGIVKDIVNMIYNIQFNSISKLTEMITAGRYNDNAQPKLYLNKEVLKWQNGTKITPVSKCSPDCEKGWRRVLPSQDPKCCWSCIKCSNGSASYEINSASCQKCNKMSVPNPKQTSCVQFRTTSFRWFDPVGEFMIFLITAGLCVTFFTLGIFSQNRECAVVKKADYKLMVCMLFGITLCFFTPVPLLLKPSSATCISYVIMFNFGLTIPLAILFIKSAAVRYRFFDENMELVNGSLGSMPHLVIAGIIIAVQAIILAVGINFTSASIEYYPTNQWDLKYAECSYMKNAVFWVAFGYNVFISVLMNIASCRSTKMNDDFKEQRLICISTCIFYLVSYLFVTCLYSVHGSKTVEAASVIIVLFGLMFIFAYFGPKLRLILFHQKQKAEFGPDGKPLMQEDEQVEKAFTSHMSAIEGLKKHEKHRVIGMKVKEGPSSA